jgi:hypothetical protein
LTANDQVVVTIFNGLGGEGEEAVGPGTYLIVFKRLHEKKRCVPVNFSVMEKYAMKQRILDVQD